MTTKPKTKAKNIDEYLAALPADKRAALKKLRKTIRAAAPAGRCSPLGSPTAARRGKTSTPS